MARIEEFLKRYNRGKHNAIPADSLALKVFGTASEATKRAMRSEITKERERGALICSCREPGRNGYFYSTNLQELERELNRRETEIKKKWNHTVRPLQDAIGRIKENRTSKPLFPEECGTTPAEPLEPED